MILDLLKIACRNTRLQNPPARGNWNKAALSYWKKEIARYLLFVMQRVQFLDLRPENKQNILYQLGYSADISLEKQLGVTESEALNNIPYWISIPKLSAAQLTLLAIDQSIEIPKNCTRTREALSRIILENYNRWDNVLNDESCSRPDLLETFDHVEDFSFHVPTAKIEIRKIIQPIRPGKEIIILWLTTEYCGFCPTVRRVPGPTIHKRLINS